MHCVPSKRPLNLERKGTELLCEGSPRCINAVHGEALYLEVLRRNAWPLLPHHPQHRTAQQCWCHHLRARPSPIDHEIDYGWRRSWCPLPRSNAFLANAIGDAGLAAATGMASSFAPMPEALADLAPWPYSPRIHRLALVALLPSYRHSSGHLGRTMR